MKIRGRQAVVTIRLATVLGVLAGITLTAVGPSTLIGLLPYFTIQSNLAVGILAGYGGWRAWHGRSGAPSLVTGAVTLYITITAVVYHLVLANPASPFAMAQPERDLAGTIGNQLLHTVVPLLALLDWLLYDARGRYQLRFAAYWLAFPLGYLGFALIRGLIVKEYPYPFIDAAALGYGGVGLSTLLFGGAFWLLGLGFIGIDRSLLRLTARRTPAVPATGPAPVPAPEPAEGG